jgi:hypothetical protein
MDIDRRKTGYCVFSVTEIVIPFGKLVPAPTQATNVIGCFGWASPNIAI